MFSLTVDNDLELRLLTPPDAPALFSLTEANRDHLRQFLPWLDHVTVEADSLSFIERCLREFADGHTVATGIWHCQQLVGTLSLQHIEPRPARAQVGYWIAEEAQGQGLVTRGCETLLDYDFQHLDLHRIEILCATCNPKSNAIPQHLGFTHEATLREWAIHYGERRDMELYAMLCHQWTAPHAGPH